MKPSFKLLIIICLVGFSRKASGQLPAVREFMVTAPNCNEKKIIEINKKYPLPSKMQLETLNYLRNIEFKKADYICQPFSKLLNDMKFAKPIRIWIRPTHGIRKLVDVTILCFNEKCPFDPDNAGCLYIIWDEPLHYRDSGYNSLEIKNKNYFTKDEEDIFNSKLIKDIRVYIR